MSAACAATLAAYLFLNAVTLRIGSHGGGAYLDAAQLEQLYYAHQIVYVLGLLSFPLSRRALRGARARRALTAGALLGCAAGTAVLLSGGGAYAYYGAASLAVFCLGHLGGRVHWGIALAADGTRLGASMGAGFAAAYALQYALQLWRGAPPPLLPAAMLAAFAVLAWLLLRRPEPEDAAPAGDAPPARRVPARTLACVSVATAALILLNCFYDGYIERLQVATGFAAYTAFDWPRLLLVPGCLLFGLLYDVRDGRYLPLAALYSVLPALLLPILTASPGMYRLNLCLFYVGVSAAVSYFSLTFCRLARRTRCPELWAGMGRVIDGALGAALWLMGFSRLSAAAALAVEAAVLGVLIAALAADGQLDLSGRHRAAESPAPAGDAPAVPPEPPADPLAVLRERYALTPRETEVLRALLTSDGDQQQIAAELHITVSTLQHHTTAIYRKTGAENRAGLYRLQRECAGGEP